MFIALSAETYGDAASSSEFQGRIVTSRKIEPTKKTQIRVMTELAARATARSGSSDSAAAMVAISAPTIEKITVTTAAPSANAPLGRKPPCAVRLEKSISLLGHRPKTKRVPSARKARIAATLMPANQNSNSPKEDTLIRLVPIISAIITPAKIHTGTSGNQ